MKSVLLVSGLALPVAAAAQPAPVIIPGPQTQADRDLIAKDPDQAGAAMAGVTFAYGCLLRASAAASARDYANQTNQLADAMRNQYPELASLPFALEGVNGDTCRVTYHGAHVDVLWKALANFKAAKSDTACTQAPATADRTSMSCTASHDNPAYDQRAERVGDHLSISVTWRGPKLP